MKLETKRQSFCTWKNKRQIQFSFHIYFIYQTPLKYHENNQSIIWTLKIHISQLKPFQLLQNSLSYCNLLAFCKYKKREERHTLNAKHGALCIIVVLNTHTHRRVRFLFISELCNSATDFIKCSLMNRNIVDLHCYEKQKKIKCDVFLKHTCVSLRFISRVNIQLPLLQVSSPFSEPTWIMNPNKRWRVR